MENQKSSLFFISIVIIISSSSVFGLSPMGAPKANLTEGKWSLGLEYEHSNMDIETSLDFSTEIIDGTTMPPSVKSKYKIEDLKSDMFFTNVGYGITENCDIYLRLGISDAQTNINEIQAGGTTGEQFRGFDSNFGFAWGIGSRATFFEEGNLSIGGLLQTNWTNPDSSEITISGDPYFSGKAEIEYWEIQMAAGPTFEFDYFRIYGGPFLHFLSGDIDLNGTGIYPGPTTITLESSKDIEKNTEIGGFVGVQFDIEENYSLYTECQFTSDAWGLGAGIIWKF